MSSSFSHFTLPEAAHAAGIQYRTLHIWVNRGLVTPAYPSQGAGHPAYLSPDDVALCRMLGRLRRAGCGIEILQRAAKANIPGARLTRLKLSEGVVLDLDRS